MTFDLKSHLSLLCDTPGVSGHEAPIRAVIAEAWSGLTDDLQTDTLGNLVGLRRANVLDGKPRRIMLAAHMDEIGLMVTHIEDGFLRVNNIGGVDRRVLPGQEVIVHGRKPLPGIIAARPPHITPAAERKSYPRAEDLSIDLGLSARQVAQQVSVGDVVTIDRPATMLNSNLLTGKALDNRAGVASLTACLHELQSRHFSWDVLAVATTQEEVGLRGAYTSTYHLQPDVAIVVDTTFGIGTAVSEGEGFALDGGPVPGIGVSVHVRLFERLLETANQMEMELAPPEAFSSSSGTDAMAVEVSRDGVPTAVLSIAIRNMHTPVEIVALDDVERTGRLLAEFITGLDGETLDSLSMRRSV